MENQDNVICKRELNHSVVEISDEEGEEDDEEEIEDEEMGERGVQELLANNIDDV